MTKEEAIKNYTDIEQSKKLAEILPLESADMVYIASADDDDDGEPLYTAEYKSEIITQEDDEDIPCWSLAALLGVLPNKYVIVKNYRGDYYVESCDHKKSTIIFSNSIDACYEMILKLNELNLL